MMETHALVATCDPEFVKVARDELDAVAAGAQSITMRAPGVLVAHHSATFGELAAAWRGRPPIFVRHICPVHVTASLTGGENDVETLAHLVAGELAAWVEPDAAFSVQTRLLASVAYRPLAVNDALAQMVTDISGAALDVRKPRQVLSVVVAGQDVSGSGPVEGLLGLSRVEDNLSDWAGGVRRFAREDGQVSRSEFKLLEALEVFGVEIPPRSTALDLGASPGGWTRVLRSRQVYVTAVDPGELDPRLAGDRGIRYRCMTADAYLASVPDSFDLIVNDMRMDGRDSARLMVRFAPYLYPHGQAIVTLKLPAHNAVKVLEHALAILREAYTVAGVRQLFHNRSEVTVFLRMKDEG